MIQFEFECVKMNFIASEKNVYSIPGDVSLDIWPKAKGLNHYHV